jgi:cellobiose-specific phosphotransferase system component IIB
MKRGIASILATALVLSLGVATGLNAQAKKDEATKLDRLEGYVLSINKDASEIRIRQRGSTSTEWTIVYTPETKFTYRNAEATLDKVKEKLRVICLGKFGTTDKDKMKMTAARIDVRTDK